MSNIIVRPLPELQVISKAVFESGFYGFKNQNQAFTALIASQDMGMNATKFCQDYHIINNRPSKKTETAFRDFKRAGGRCKWIETSEEVARAELVAPDGDSILMKYTIEQARKAGLIKDNWLKNPADMLRSRVLSKGIKAVYPQAYDGFLSEDEAIDLEPIEESKEDIIECETIESKNIEADKKVLTLKLRKLDFTNAMIKEFAEKYNLLNDGDLLNELVTNEQKLMELVKEFEKW